MYAGSPKFRRLKNVTHSNQHLRRSNHESDYY
jgi:hypothetical protein